MLGQIRSALRITHHKLDDDLQLNIGACKLDLQRVGVDTSSQYDTEKGAIIQKAIELYVKWQYDYCGKGEQFRKNYESMRDALSLSSDFNGGEKHV